LTKTSAFAFVRTAIDRGNNFMDNCWDYNDGDSERRMGKALRAGYRAKAFLMTRLTGGRSRKRLSNWMNRCGGYRWIA
jgi:predicted aldo/keto reductase-like oxidoreductase